ncbi:NAD(P)/FAD-dependent oxidoreductase [Mongoliitalea daihaiensis]|uniref:NAD(P)/FAD-dependent oxidoreductase n=1 Tax=Mongoliitalea daihaiensis TaxID=2782006 RepID=UPI001F3C70AE|nr:FAD-dependent oxidoreductase [Mongoliitalea daihaiensis]UJP63313.1 FAD-binding oxidoreductase [Mongoliitalea daihaiensis]
MEIDFLLIGQGLAGTALSYRLLKAGRKVLVMDLPHENQSSRIAAGLYNPITGKKMVKTWKGDVLFPEIEPFYEQLEKELEINFLYKKAIYRPFLSIEEQNEWMGYSGEEGFQAYFQEIFQQTHFPEVVNPYGGILLAQSGYLDIPTYLDTYRDYLIRLDAYREERYDEEFLMFTETGVRYKEINAKGIVYCNGLGTMGSKYFSNAPFAPVKGEILDIQQDFVPDEIINRGVFRIPLSNGNLRVGSTYTWHDLDSGPTERAKEEIFEKLDKLMVSNEKVLVAHRTGIRPATKDRKPFLGKHPEFSSVYIFNGFGAKGVSLTPYFSKVMTDLLLNNQNPEKEVNISRWK